MREGENILEHELGLTQHHSESDFMASLCTLAQKYEIQSGFRVISQDSDFILIFLQLFGHK